MKLRYEQTAKVLKTAREKLNITQGSIAQKLGYKDPRAISNFECGYNPIPVRKMVIYAKLVRVSKQKLESFLVEDILKSVRSTTKS